MYFPELKQHLSRIQPLTGETYAAFEEKLTQRRFKKGDFIINPGEIQKELLFVQIGVQMAFYENTKKTYVMAFTYPPDFCAIPDSFSFQKPSNYHLQCLSDSEMLAIKHDDLSLLFDQHHELDRLFRKMTEAVLAGVLSRHLELQTDNIEDRFRTFCHRSPHLLQLVPHKYLASYLNIDATNFSKLYNSIRI